MLDLKMSALKRVLFRSTIRNLIVKKWRSEISVKSFSLISQNCIGGCIYHTLGAQFQSPTINLYLDGTDFLKLIQRLDFYFKIDAKPAGYEKRPDGTSTPLIRVDDILVHALHYDSPELAAASWNKRKLRVDMSNVYVIANSWNCDNDVDLLSAIDQCEYPTAIFSDFDCNLQNQILLRGSLWARDERGIVRPDLTSWDDNGLRYYEEVFDFVGWINNPNQPVSHYVSEKEFLKEES